MDGTEDSKDRALIMIQGHERGDEAQLWPSNPGSYYSYQKET